MPIVFTKDDMTWFIYITLIFAISVYILIPILDSVSPTNFIFSYTVYILAYAVFVILFVFKNRISLKHVLGIAMLFLASDIIMPPLLVTAGGVVQGLPPVAEFSSDIYIYTIIYGIIPVATIDYFLTYVIIPAILIITARKLLTKTMFRQEVF